MNVDEFFTGYELSRPLFDALKAVIDDIGPAEQQVTKSQIAFRRRKAFAWAWIPDKYLHGRHALLVLSIALPYRDDSPRWKQIVEPSPGRFMHHLEWHAETDIDQQIRARLREAWAFAA